MENRAYVYRHRRLDNNEIFSIGIGVQSGYKRAFEKRKRTTHWINIVKKYDYEVEIIADFLAEEDAKELEVFLISLYGRKDLKEGNLINLTDGGEGVLGYICSQETKEKISIAQKGKKKKSYVMKKPRDVNGDKNNRFGKLPPNAKIVLDTEMGIFYESLKAVSKVFNINYNTLKNRLNGRIINKTKFIYC